eukprot:Tbor_TRINITY_DN5869_c0_g7::TRINITY_DN5869_c0_g7_i2::g.6554::m.6554
MSLNLRGKTLRTIVVENCPDGFSHEFATLIAQRCQGTVEEWECVKERIFIVFSSPEAASLAREMSGIGFGGNRIRIFVANDTGEDGKPMLKNSHSSAAVSSAVSKEEKRVQESRNKAKEAVGLGVGAVFSSDTIDGKGMLMLTGPSSSESVEGDLVAPISEERLDRRRRREAILKSLGGKRSRADATGKTSSYIPNHMSSEEKEIFICQHLKRQCDALAFLTEEYCEEMEAEVAALGGCVERAEDLSTASLGKS